MLLPLASLTLIEGQLAESSLRASMADRPAGPHSGSLQSRAARSAEPVGFSVEIHRLGSLAMNLEGKIAISLDSDQTRAVPADWASPRIVEVGREAAHVSRDVNEGVRNWLSCVVVEDSDLVEVTLTATTRKRTREEEKQDGDVLHCWTSMERFGPPTDLLYAVKSSALQ